MNESSITRIIISIIEFALSLEPVKEMLLKALDVDAIVKTRMDDLVEKTQGEDDIAEAVQTIIDEIDWSYELRSDIERITDDSIENAIDGIDWEYNTRDIVESVVEDVVSNTNVSCVEARVEAIESALADARSAFLL